MTTADLSPAAAKAALRGQIRHVRRDRSDLERVHAAGSIAARALPLLADSSLIACYVSMPVEPGTAALIDLLRQRDIRVVLPRVNGDVLDWVELTDATHFTTSGLGILEPDGPVANDALAECNAFVLPALAVSREGIRLGQGGGFYDRTLESLPAKADGGPVRIALLFDDELVDSVPHESHDARVDQVVMPERVVSF